MKEEIIAYNDSQLNEDKLICDRLMKIIDSELSKAENKIWHRHPVWFLDGNPIAGYGKLKGCIRLMFWSGMSFDEPDLKPATGKFKDASIRYSSVSEINEQDLRRWLKKSKKFQWDYKNIYKTKGMLNPLKGV